MIGKIILFWDGMGYAKFYVRKIEEEQ